MTWQPRRSTLLISTGALLMLSTQTSYEQTPYTTNKKPSVNSKSPDELIKDLQKLLEEAKSHPYGQIQIRGGYRTYYFKAVRNTKDGTLNLQTHQKIKNEYQDTDAIDIEHLAVDPSQIANISIVPVIYTVWSSGRPADRPAHRVWIQLAKPAPAKSYFSRTGNARNVELAHVNFFFTKEDEAKKVKAIFEGLSAPKLEETPVPLPQNCDFGEVKVKQYKDLTFTTTVTGVKGSTVTVTGQKITGPDKDDFKIITSNYIGTHRVGDVLTQTIRFTPSKNGDENAQISCDVRSPDAQAGVTPWPLTGSGLGPRAFFYIAYLNYNKDKKADPNMYQSFVDAAQTWRRDIETQHKFDPDEDKFIEANVRSANDFVKAWEDINRITAKGKTKYRIIAGSVFAHSSYPGPSLSPPSIIWESGMEFGLELDTTSKDSRSTLNKNQISMLPRLSWNKNSSLELFGCNTGVMRGLGSDAWSPAETFAKTQKVKTWGENGFAYFSEDLNKYVMITKGSRNIYLRAYAKLRNIGVSDARIPPISYTP